MDTYPKRSSSSENDPKPGWQIKNPNTGKQEYKGTTNPWVISIQLRKVVIMLKVAQQNFMQPVMNIISLIQHGKLKEND